MSTVMAGARIALVHDYLADLRGGERVFVALSRMFPEADLYTLVFEPKVLGDIGEYFRERGLRTSWAQRLPNAGPWFQRYVPLYPLAARSLDLRGYDLVISSSSGWAHAARVGRRTVHVCYCYTPFRYAWSHYRDLTTRGLWSRALSPVLLALRRLDLRASRNVGHYVAISRLTQQRILQSYGRSSVVINPPVDTGRFAVSDAVNDYMLVVSSLIPYKRVDIAIEACNRLGRKLKVVGVGPEQRRLQALAGPTVEFLGRVDDERLAHLYSHCAALLFPPVEDFGLVPLEAMASGRPVVAFRAGGALESMVDGLTGVFFDDQTADSLERALLKLDPASYDPMAIRRHAEAFSVPVFQERMRAFLNMVLPVRAAAVSSPS